MLFVHWQAILSSLPCIRQRHYMTRWQLHTDNICLSVCYNRGEMDMQCVLAVDGGNTKTIALVATLDGTILGAGRGGCSDIYNAHAGTDWPDSATAAVANIEYAVVSALQAANVKAPDLVASVFNMAGAGWAEEFFFFYNSIEAFGFLRNIFILDESLGVLHAGGLYHI